MEKSNKVQIHKTYNDVILFTFEYNRSKKLDILFNSPLIYSS